MSAPCIQDRPVTIYAMAHPEQPSRIRYIGKTKHLLIKRLDSHMYGRNRDKCPKNDWLRKVVGEGKVPVIWPLEVCNSGNWESRERYWIWLFRPLGLLNICEGGETGPDGTGKIKSEETRRKLSIANTGKRNTPESLARMSASQKKLKGSPEERERNRRIQLVVKNTPEFRSKASAWRMRFWHDPEYSHKAEKLRETLKARKHDPVYILRLQSLDEQRRGIRLTTEHRERLSESHRGHVKSKETKDKIRQSNIENSPSRKSVECIDTGKTFPSIKQAAKQVSGTDTGISVSIKRGTKYKGQQWRFV